MDTKTPLEKLKVTLLQYFNDIESIVLIKTGNDNENYSFQSGNIKYIFRIYNELTKKRSEEEILEEINFINFFNDHQISTPRVLPNRDGRLVSKIDDRFCAVFEFCEGGFVYGRLKATHFAQVGELIAKIHQLTEQNNLTTKKMWRSGNKWDYLAIKVSENANVLNEEEKNIYLELKNNIPLFQSEPKHFTHDDYHFANILFDQDKLSALLDFDGYNNGHFSDDIGRFLIADLAYNDATDFHETQEFVDIFFESYMKIRNLNDLEKRLIKLYVSLHNLLQLIRLSKDWPEKIPEFRDQTNQLHSFLVRTLK